MKGRRQDSRCQAHWFECVKNCNTVGFFHTQQFPVCIKNGPRPKGHPDNLTQLWEALDPDNLTQLWEVLDPDNLTQLWEALDPDNLTQLWEALDPDNLTQMWNAVYLADILCVI
jgi:hypothetical protein